MKNWQFALLMGMLNLAPYQKQSDADFWGAFFLLAAIFYFVLDLIIMDFKK